MKSSFLTTLLVTIFFCQYGKSQNKDSVVMLPPVTITSFVMINQELNKSFEKSFPEAYDLHWYKLDRDYLAKFIKDDLKHQSLFKKNGIMKYDITYGSESNLPGDVQKIIKDGYSDFKITNAAKVIRNDQDFWIVNLEGMNNYVVARVENGDVEEVKRIKKSE